MTKALEFDVVGSVPVCLKNPSFSAKSPLWVKNDEHPYINPNDIKSKRYEFIKIGKTFGFETTRYMALHQDFLFYFDVLTSFISGLN